MAASLSGSETPIGVESASKAGRSKACNECKQQKLRCDRAPDAAEACSRCQRLRLDCKIENGFKRTRKRSSHLSGLVYKLTASRPRWRRSFELEGEIRELQHQLRRQNAPTTTTSTSPQSQGQVSPPSVPRHLPISQQGGDVSQDDGHSSRDLDAIPAATSEESPAAAERHAHKAGFTTKPAVDDEPDKLRRVVPIRQPRALSNTALSENEIDELFTMYMTYYHPFLPLIDANKSPHELYAASELLFWVIISVASRHLRARPTLLAKLARSVTDLLWATIRSIPYSLATVQALALLCTWPFPTSSSTADPTFMLTGMMSQIATQMGLHRAIHAQEFVKVPRRLGSSEQIEWARTWQACNVVAQSVSVGCGLPVVVTQMNDCALTTMPPTTVDAANPLNLSMTFHLRVEQFRHRTSQALMASSPPSSNDGASTRERLALYELLGAALAELERDAADLSYLSAWYVSAARLHFHAFYLFDDCAMDGYAERIVTLYHTAYHLIEQSLELDNREGSFFEYCPFFCYQAFVCAAFVVRKILSNGFFQPLLDEVAGMGLLDAAIVALRKMSVVNNDLPARLGDVLGFFCALPDSTVLGGTTIDMLQLQQVKHRLSMSVVYDSLWTWRQHFKDADDTATDAADGQAQSRTQDEPFPFMLQSFDFNAPGGLAGLTDIGWFNCVS